MGDDLELRQRVEGDERATLARIESLQGQLAVEQRHLAEVRLFQSMLNGYAGAGATTSREADASGFASTPIAGDAETEAGLSAAQADELDRLNRLFGLNAGSN